MAAAITASLLTIGAPAAGEVAGTGSHYYLTDGWDGQAARSFAYGRADDVVHVGDWDGDGVDTLAVRRGATYHVSDSLTGGAADRVLTYGRPGDTVLMGDWDADGVDTPAVRRGSTYLVTNSLTGGHADVVVGYGRPDDVVVVGDWDGDGRDTLGVRRGATYYLSNSLSGGPADVVVGYGRERDEVVVGDWDGDGHDSLAVRRGTVVHARNTISAGPAELVMAFGRADDAVLVGDWTGDGRDTVGVRAHRPAEAAAEGLSAFDTRMVELINAERARGKVPALEARPDLRAGALRHSGWMAGTGSFEHASSSTIAADGRAAGCRATAENIFWGSRGFAEDPAAVLREYMSSPGHRANILDPRSAFVAVGTVQADNGRIYNTQRFAADCS